MLTRATKLPSHVLKKGRKLETTSTLTNLVQLLQVFVLNLFILSFELIIVYFCRMFFCNADMGVLLHVNRETGEERGKNGAMVVEGRRGKKGKGKGKGLLLVGDGERRAKKERELGENEKMNWVLCF